MKFVSDSEEVFADSTLGHKTDSKPFEFSDKAFTSAEFESEKNVIKQHHKEASEDRTSAKHDRSTSLNDLTNDTEKDFRYQAAPYSCSSRETEPLEDSVFYMDKNVTEREVPEVIVCYKQSTYHVKDICVDEGAWSQDKTINPEKKGNRKLDEETKMSILSPPEALEGLKEEDSKKGGAVNQSDYSLKDDTNKDDVLQCVSKDLMLTGVTQDDASDNVANGISQGLMSLGDLIKMGRSAIENSHFKSIDNDGVQVERESFQGSGEEAATSPVLTSTVEASNAGIEEAKLSNSDFATAAKVSNIPTEEGISINPAPISSNEGKYEDTKESSHNPHPDSASEEPEKTSIVCEPYPNSKIVTSDKDASTPQARVEEDVSKNGDAEQIEVPDASKIKDTPDQPASNQVQNGVDESASSVSGPLPGLISYSGPIAYSGSLSIRSDSSTTSTRSFAFPILQSEWNSSPVRMVKPDRRHLRKTKWRQGLLCCRF